MPTKADSRFAQRKPRDLLFRLKRKMHNTMGSLLVSANIYFAVLVAVSVPFAFAQTTVGPSVPSDDPPAISSLAGIKPLLPNTSDYIRDIDAARQLGKALFWDTQAGSDGIACASCHFHAGADIRIRNQINPGLKAKDMLFSARGGDLASASGPNKTSTATDFPFHRLADPNDRESDVISDSNDVFSSQGTWAGDFVSSKRGIDALQGSGDEKCSLAYDPANNPFHANGLIYRKVESRQTPTTINAVFYYRQFWDGRANNQFNGVDPFGPRTYMPLFDDPNNPGSKIGNPNVAGAGILALDAVGTTEERLTLEKPLIQNSSLASQAVGPLLSDFEIACNGKIFADLAHKLLPMKPLSTQVADPNDSLFSKTPGLVNGIPVAGLNTTYEALIQKAFNPKYWAGQDKVVVDPASGAIIKGLENGYTQIQYNFSLFWGLAIQAYEQLLISDDAPFDRGPAAMSKEALAGLQIFTGKGKCVACHNGPLFSDATVFGTHGKNPNVIDGMLMGDGYPAVNDIGFYNIGVRPTKEDIGLGGIDPYGFSLSFARQYKWQLLGQRKKSPDRFDANPCDFATEIFPDCNNISIGPDPASAPNDSVDGAFKVPTLRNVGLTPPYFHNGSQATLKDVVRFYNRGGDRRGPLGHDTSGSDVPTPFGTQNSSNLDLDIGDATNTSGNNSLGLTEVEMDDLVQFLLSLTDQRVACHSGVFDHPELPLVVGHRDIPKGGSQRAKDIVATLPAVGQRGLSNCFPNTGDLFGTLNRSDPRKLQDTVNQIIK